MALGLLYLGALIGVERHRAGLIFLTLKRIGVDKMTRNLGATQLVKRIVQVVLFAALASILTAMVFKLLSELALA